MALSACVHTLRRSLGKEGRGAWLQQELDRTAAMGGRRPLTAMAEGEGGRAAWLWLGCSDPLQGHSA